MLNALTLIFALQLAGEVIVAAAGLTLPGPVLGMVLLLATLAFKRGVPDDIATVGDGLLRHLSLLFVPAGVGIMLHFDKLAVDGVAIAVALVGSTIATVAVTGLIMQRLSKRSPDE